MGIRGARHGCRRSRLPPPRLSQAGGVDPRGVVAPRTTAGALVHEQGGGSGPPTLHTRAWVQGMGATVPRHRPSRSLHPPRRPPSWPVAQRGRAAEPACLVCPGTVCFRISALHWLQRTILACDWTVSNASISLFSCVPFC